MGNKIEELMYKSGLTAQGSWDDMDDYDRSAIEHLSELVIEECLNIINENKQFAEKHRWSTGELAGVCVFEIKKTFGIENGKETVSG